jgi:CRISPR system Cascade subunit CasA
MENRFNLIDEKWIPIQGESPVSLLDIFSQNSPESLGGTAIQKLAVLKLLLAIAQRATTPKDVHEWNMLRPEGLGKTCTAYLNTHRDQFYL